MGRQEYLIDTNVAIDYMGAHLPESALSFIDNIIDGQFYLSVINKIELLGFPGITHEEDQNFKELINAALVLFAVYQGSAPREPRSWGMDSLDFPHLTPRTPYGPKSARI